MTDIAKLVEHPTYGSLRDLVTELHHQMQEGQWPRIGQMGALAWFATSLESLAADAGRWRFYEKNRGLIIEGIRLHDWLDDNSLRLGGVTAAIDRAREEGNE